MSGWRDRALCAQVGGDLWHPDKGRSAAPAKRICEKCPVRRDCLNYALETPVLDGVWGGKTPRERARMRLRGEAA